MSLTQTFGEIRSFSLGVRRNGLVWVLSAVLLLLVARTGSAQSTAVPAEVQAELFSKLASYDRNFATRAGGTALVLLVVKHDDAKSALFTSSIKAALARLDRIGGLPHRELVVKYEGAAKLAKLCKSERAAAVYIAPGLDAEVEAVRAALAGSNILSVAAMPDYVPKGIVLGFDLVSSKPKIVLNLNQARKQNVDFKADVMKLMRVYK